MLVHPQTLWRNKAIIATKNPLKLSGLNDFILVLIESSNQASTFAVCYHFLTKKKKPV